MSSDRFYLRPRRCDECGCVYQPTGGGQRFCARCIVIELTCEKCQRSFTKLRREYLREGSRFCSAACGRARSGADNHNYKGGLAFDSGRNRWLINCRDGSHLRYYRGVMAAQLGRLLRPDEHVHHINGDSSDDRPENLQVLSASEHARLHEEQRRTAA